LIAPPDSKPIEDQLDGTFGTGQAGPAVWCEVDSAALSANVRAIRALVGPSVRIAPAVKANGYGHGLKIAARAFLAGGADWLCVHALDEARVLRQAGITAPIHLVGPVLLDDLAEAVALDLRLVVYNAQTVARLVALGATAKLHLKVETGNHRQGLDVEEALALAAQIAQAPGLELEGVSSHFADIEDTTDHRYARSQLHRFEAVIARLRAAGHRVPIRHMANSAATLLWPDQAYELVRPGISCYGLWPSNETRVAAALAGRHALVLQPALRWKTRIMQLKWVPEGASVGYGRSYMTTAPARLAVLPVGYSDGYDRGLSNLAHVLIGGRRAPVRGRVCMNIILADVTHTEAQLEDEVVLLGHQQGARISAEQLGAWAGTINYEVCARIADHVPRLERAGSGVVPQTAPYRAPA
jgi:alanine racemase